MSDVPPTRARTSTRARSLRLPAVIVLATVVAAGLIIWFETRAGPSSSQPTTPTTTTAAKPYGPTVLDEAGLKAAVASLGQLVFWIGPRAGREYELQRLANGSVFLRYLPAGVSAGDKRPFLTIGTYPFASAYAATLALANGNGSVRLSPSGWLATYRKSKPTSIYLAKLGLQYQIEVYDPSAAQALAVARSGRLALVP